MSNIDDIVGSAQGGQLIDSLSDRFGLASWQVEAAVIALAPAVSAALIEAAESPDTLRPIVAAIGEPQHKAAFESAERALSPESVGGGEAIVASLFGSAAAAGEVSQLAARVSGLRADVVQRLLPALVSIIAGGLSSTLAERGLGDALSRPVEPDVVESAPPPIQTKQPKGLSGFLAALFGKRSAPPRAETPEPGQRADAVEEDLAQIRQIFATEAPISEDQKADLDALLDRTLGPPRD